MIRKEKILEILKGYSQKSAIGLAVEEDEFELVAEELIKNCFISTDVISQRELLLDFAEYSENDKTSTAIDECVDNYLDSIKQ